MRYYLIAGEESGDLHGANLMKAIKAHDKAPIFRCWGGDKMENQGATMVKHIRDLAFMGFVEVIMNIRTIMGNISLCKKDLLNFQADVLILIDYPGFNLRIAEFAKKNGIRVFYYISPQIWAWKASRVKQIKRNVEEMFVILPFEKEFYARYDYPVHFVGHPLLDAIAQFSEKSSELDKIEKPIIALLPGSRKQEIKTMLPEMLKIEKHFKDYQIVVAGVKSYGEENYDKLLKQSNARIVTGSTYELLSKASAALVTSGTATLETALFNVPQVVCYKGAYISYIIARQLIKVKYISLVNLILDRQAVKELIQKDMNAEQMIAALENLLTTKSNVRKQLMRDYDELHAKLGGEGASERAALMMINILSGAEKGEK
jgi:lipid-A-disaccharide synthase